MVSVFTEEDREQRGRRRNTGNSPPSFDAVESLDLVMVVYTLVGGEDGL